MLDATLTPKIPIAAITVMKEIRLTGAELRFIDRKNVLDLYSEEPKKTTDQLTESGLRVISASPLSKCVLPNGPHLDEMLQRDVFAFADRFEEQYRLRERALEVAGFFQASILRVFSYWRTVTPRLCLEPIGTALSGLAAQAKSHRAHHCSRNEYACNLATAADVAEALKLIPYSSVAVAAVWDPQTRSLPAKARFPEGYSLLPTEKSHCACACKKTVTHRTANPCGGAGARRVRWKEQIAASLAEGYKGYISLETHWPGPAGNKLEAGRICGWNLRILACG